MLRSTAFPFGRLAGSTMIGALVLSSGSPLLAQDLPQDQDQDWRSLFQELQEQNAELETRLTAVEESDSSGSDASEQYGMVATYQDVRATFQIFGDVGLKYRNPESANKGHTSSTFGTVDVFMTAQMGEHFQVLSETVLTGSDSEGHFAQERLWGAWTVDDRLYAKLGLEHSPISLWNSRYHHGAWLEPTIQRPLMANYEGSSDGFLPLHNQGVELGGKSQVGEGALNYKLIFSNGRGNTPKEKQKVSDANDEKALVLALSVAPGLGDLHFGVAADLDDIPANTAAGGPTGPLSQGAEERVFTAFIETSAGPLKLLTEAATMTNEINANNSSYDHWSGYFQVLWPLEDWTPYVRYDLKNMTEGDPYLALADKDLDQWRATAGSRNDFATNAAFKIEVSVGERDERAAGGAITLRQYVSAAFQLAWAI